MKIISEIEKKLIAKFNDVISYHKEEHAELMSLFELCESPIEQKLLFHFIEYYNGYKCDWEGLHMLSLNFCSPHFLGFDIRIYPQREIPISIILYRQGKKLYKADFLFRLSRWNHDKGIHETLCELIVEVDDQNYTKKLADIDKSRERSLKAAGYTVIRITSPFKIEDILDEIYSFLIQKVSDFVAQRGLKFY